MALGHDLGADQNIDFALHHGPDCRLGFRRAMHGIGRRNCIARIGEEPRKLLGHPLHARPAGNQRAAFMAFGTFRWRGDFIATLMTGQPSSVFVFHQPGRTVRAGEFVAARLAQGQRGITAPVQEQHSLFACGQSLFQCRPQRRRQPLAPRRFIGRVPFIAHVDQAHLRQFGDPVAPAQDEMAIASARGIDEAFQRRRSRCQHHRTALDAGAYHRHVAGVIDGAVLLLEGLFVLFVHHDKSQFGKGQEQGRARAHHHPRLAPHHRAVCAPPLLL